jgi:starch synthase (maltosyl-transferring)
MQLDTTAPRQVHEAGEYVGHDPEKEAQSVPAPTIRQPPPRIQIERPEPMVDCGRHPAKACVGDEVAVTADIFRDGHEVLRAVVRTKGPGDKRFTGEYAMHPVDHDRGGLGWAGAFGVDRCGRWSFQIESWVDSFASWRDEVQRKVTAGQTELGGELSEGVVLLEQAAARAKGEDKRRIEAVVASEPDDPVALLDLELAEIVERNADRSSASRMAKALEVEVDRVRARFGAWYELFPRSWGGFTGVQEQLPKLAELGFDVLYLPPIHPIGHTNRKGANNALTAEPGDPGSPWAIGDETGGHDAIHPDLGTEEEFVELVETARAEHGIEVALDFAIQCSADHPWLQAHPEWFNHRPDGTLKYAENPPKKYQDIYNVNWDSEDWRGLWNALLEVVDHWVERGVRVFRVDNPHTKPLAFWEWLIAEVKRDHPDAIFLSEAFTKLPMMRALAKLGFSQSYTYFTWKSSTWELREYMDELLSMAHVLRPNFFVNTPDILTEELQHGGPAAFHARLVLAATLSPSYGVYSGFESFENVAVRPGSEEYLDSEKYEVKQRALDGPLLPRIGRLNAIRREHPALQRLDNISFLATENDALLGYAKREREDLVLCIVNVDPHHVQEGVAVVPYELGLPPAFAMEDLLDGARYDWRLGRNYVRLDPGAAHVLTPV